MKPDIAGEAVQQRNTQAGSEGEELARRDQVPWVTSLSAHLQSLSFAEPPSVETHDETYRYIDIT